jgi:leucine efflux protein
MSGHVGAGWREDGSVLGITDFWTYVLGTAAIIVLPGPNALFVLSVAARAGVRAGYRAACGVFLGDAVLMVLSAAGVASLLQAYPPVFLIIKYAGAGYLAWVGLGIIRGALRKWRRRDPATDPSAGRDALHASGPARPGDGHGGVAAADVRRPFRRAAVVSLLNPKAILFFVSFFIQFVEPGYAHPALSFLVLGLVVQLFSFLYLSFLIFGGRFLAGQFRRRRRLAAAAGTGIGALFVGFGIKLAAG